MSLAIFDLDNTLLSCDSDHAWGEFLVEQGAVDGDAYRRANDQFLADYRAGRLDLMAYLSMALKPLTENSEEQLRAWHQQFMACKIEPNVLPQGEELLAWHRQRGDFLLIVTATNRFVTGPIAERLGVDDLIAVEPARENGAYTGQITGVPSYREGKVTRMETWLEGHPTLTLDDAWFYSDSINDRFLLERVANPVAVDPDDALRQLAGDNGWRVLSLRES
ncbi:HAD family hydrolase [Salinicola rhizosphaerae]|uniref:Haloacid dehalogenase n=1 Tax=Salinicola rhizosphaerae TaxID=1443141 RepID=A0ABQ3E3U2_9GAMM|nr:HAD family hydrolase [Salinicola rhizosphaerae]GHB25018.1 haloacid dehalogenase [Salinicola rhizosphaerae]